MEVPRRGDDRSKVPEAAKFQDCWGKKGPDEDLSSSLSSTLVRSRKKADGSQAICHSD